jgi:hypothetical protein
LNAVGLNAIVTNTDPTSPALVQQTLAQLTGIVAIVRLRHTTPSDGLLGALLDGGVRCVEITLPTPGSLAAVSDWASEPRATSTVSSTRPGPAPPSW